VAQLEMHDPDTDRLWRLRWWLVASLICVSFSLGYVLISAGTDWLWPLFLWGLGVSLLGFAVICGLFLFAIRREEVTEAMRTQLRRRLGIYTVCWVVTGLGIGSSSAAFDLPWLDVVVTVYVGLVWVGGVYAWRRIARSRAPAR
jgi:hypothetical protein